MEKYLPVYQNEGQERTVKVEDMTTTKPAWVATDMMDHVAGVTVEPPSQVPICKFERSTNPPKVIPISQVEEEVLNLNPCFYSKLATLQLGGGGGGGEQLLFELRERGRRGRRRRGEGRRSHQQSEESHGQRQRREPLE